MFIHPDLFAYTKYLTCKNVSIKHGSCMKSEICYYCDEHDIKYQTQVYY